MSETFDSNHDGYVDTYGADTNGDGYLDTYTYDANEDGYLDGVGVDANEDGVLDQYRADLDEDGYETYPVDTGSWVEGMEGSSGGSAYSVDTNGWTQGMTPGHSDYSTLPEATDVNGTIAVESGVLTNQDIAESNGY